MVELFIEKMKEESITIKQNYNKKIKMKKIINQEEIKFNNAEICHICGTKLTDVPVLLEKYTLQLLKSFE